ncbi:hypothetical protein ACFWYW_24145 [Nonomuraea sp. NPDC059023]|uniref:hypothetical protein n=1 Tax=unclassified Nonomuraea TaxID=2593643 RepID=UPI0036C26CC5
MAATYPGGIRTWTTKLGWRNIVWASHVNELQDEEDATQRILGLNPHQARNNPGGLSRDYGTLARRLTAHARGEDLPFYRGMAKSMKTTPNTWNTVAFEHRSDPFELADSGPAIKLSTHGLWVLAARAEWRATGYSLQKRAKRRLRILLDDKDVGLSDFTAEDARNSFALHNQVTWQEVLPRGTRVSVQVRTNLDAPPHDLLANIVLRAYLVRCVDRVVNDGALLRPAA